MSFPFYKQLDASDCGPTCLKMIAKHYGKNVGLQTLRQKSHITRAGVSLMGISDAANDIGIKTTGVRCSFDTLVEEAQLPVIVHWNQKHFVVIHSLRKKRKQVLRINVADPACGLVSYTKDDFLKGWVSTRTLNEDKGIALLLDPTPEFYKWDSEEQSKKTSFAYLFSYLKPFKKTITQLMIGLFVGSLLQLLLPFLTQSIVDIGIGTRNINFIYLVLTAQIILYASRMAIDFIRSRILLHISARVNISIISEFLVKMMKLPLGFFDTKLTGDILQRINDHHRIETFLTSSVINILFAIFNLIVFGIVIAIYSSKIFLIFFVGSILHIAWSYLFLSKRREYDFKRFSKQAEDKSKVLQLIHGIQDIKLNNCENQKRWEWESIQAKLFKISIRNLNLNQYQQSGAIFINEVKNFTMSFMAATAVIDGSLTLGMMVALQYIIGQLNSPVEHIIQFMHSFQDASISLERLGEIHDKPNEEISEMLKISKLPENRNIKINSLTFQYDGPHSHKVLDSINLEIQQGKVTAIVGNSGSGKTTLLKLLLGFYQPSEGEVFLGDINFRNVNHSMWRQHCGAVLQDGFIFSDTIANNIVLEYNNIDIERLMNAAKLANIDSFIESLPLGYNTKIGQEGHGLSQGQKQRILIARAVYKNPEFLFFDEATNALDANNEKQILHQLNQFYKGKTVLVIAHRLSTVKNADKIVVLKNGRIAEQGTHTELIKLKGEYFNLVINQLELGG
ncbi:MAG: ABC transporter ATP-binding protein [Bacteroidetes bacterium GWA2_31_9]|nr:MAG: ABC transporter ATP-binding protein [Bacteroidetes bacterium GWA2_31_9]